MRVRFALSSLALAVVAIACGRQPEVADSGSPDVHALQLRTFETLWTTVYDNYVYQDFQGVDWRGVRDEYQSLLDSELETNEFVSVMDAMLQELPAGTAQYQSRATRIEQATSDVAGYQGIGSFVGVRGAPDPRIVLLSVMPGSPAELAGLKPHDAVLAIDGVPVRGRDRSDEIDRVRGPAGSEVTLTVRSPGEAPRDVVVTRGQISSTQDRLSWRPIDGTNVGYFLFPPADYEQLIQDIVVGLQSLNESGDLEALIFDLRIVTGASNWPAATLLTLFTDGNVGEIYSRVGSTPLDVEGIFDFVDTQSLPVAVLVGPSTTGAAEVFAAAMQASDQAIVVGMETPGEVETVSPFFLPDGSRAFVATASFRPANGREVGLEGVMPDVLVAIDWDEVTSEDDNVIDSAVEAVLSNSS